MVVPRFVQAIVVCVSIISVFWFPWPMTLGLMFCAGLILPPLPFGIGVLADILYYSGTGVPWGTLSGMGMCGFVILVRHFVKTRIM